MAQQCLDCTPREGCVCLSPLGRRSAIQILGGQQGEQLPWLPSVSWGFTGAGQQRCLYPVTSESNGGTSGKKGNIVVTVTGRGGGSGETTGKYCLHVGFGSCLCARDPLLCACTMLLHRLLQAAPGPPEKLPVLRASLSSVLYHCFMAAASAVARPQAIWLIFSLVGCRAKGIQSALCLAWGGRCVFNLLDEIL